MGKNGVMRTLHDTAGHPFRHVGESRILGHGLTRLWHEPPGFHRGDEKFSHFVV